MYILYMYDVWYSKLFKQENPSRIIIITITTILQCYNKRNEKKKKNRLNVHNQFFFLQISRAVPFFFSSHFLNKFSEIPVEKKKI